MENAELIYELAKRLDMAIEVHKKENTKEHTSLLTINYTN